MRFRAPSVLAILCACALGPASARAQLEPMRVDVVPTSGRDAKSLFSEQGGSWVPDGDPRNEGLLLRVDPLLEITGTESLEIEACPGAGRMSLRPYVNGVEAATLTFDGARGTARLPLDSEEGEAFISSIFLRVQAASNACLRRIALTQDGQARKILVERKAAATVSASSTLTPAEAYAPDYLFDGRPEYGWVAGGGKDGVGESVTARFESEQEFSGLLLENGYQRSDDHFRKNARAKKISVQIDDGPAQVLEIGANADQSFQLARPARGKRFTLKILEAYPGTRYKDLVLSELLFIDGQGRWGVRTAGIEQRQRALKALVVDSSLEKALDRSWQSRCATAKTRRELKLRSNSSFVWYDDSAPAKEFVDGAWALKDREGAWSRIDLFGRRRRISTKWVPYEGAKVARESEEVRIAGGSVSVASVSRLGKAETAKLLEEWSSGPMKRAVGCLAGKPDWAETAYSSLSAAGAIFVKGPAMSDLLWLEPSAEPAR